MDTIRERVEEPAGTEALWAGHAGPLRGVRVNVNLPRPRDAVSPHSGSCAVRR